MRDIIIGMLFVYVYKTSPLISSINDDDPLAIRTEPIRNLRKVRGL